MYQKLKIKTEKQKHKAANQADLRALTYGVGWEVSPGKFQACNKAWQEQAWILASR